MGLSFGYDPAAKRGDVIALIQAWREQGVKLSDVMEAYGPSERSVKFGCAA
jgi:hypothetical protein